MEPFHNFDPQAFLDAEEIHAGPPSKHILHPDNTSVGNPAVPKISHLSLNVFL